MKLYNEKKELMRIVCNCCGAEYNASHNFVKADFLSVRKTWGYFSSKDGLTQEFDLCEDCFEKITQSWKIPVQEWEETEIW
ncbi:MAG: hypothetical protein ACI4C1_08045 [Lachnospiraceae bacterium]